MFTSVKRIHFVGIGGIGMSGIAEILLSQGFDVSGSDLAKSENTDYLAAKGAIIYIGHRAENIEGTDVVVYSSAVRPADNPETAEALKRNIPILRRAEMLAEVSRLNYCLAIAGTHGKTTTTSMCGMALIKAGLDPTVIVGGRLQGLGGTNALLGKGNWTIVEADEYDRSFLQLLPTVAIVNNIEAEHLDIYKDFEDLKTTFCEFVNKVPFYGFVAVGLDDAGVKDILPDINKKVISFGLSPHCDVRADDIRFSEGSSTCKVYKHGSYLGELVVKLPGIHNVKNALATVTIGTELGIEFEKIAEAISEFTGVNRRFEIKGEKDGLLIVDDYAHHPTEIRATLSAARSGWDRRVICVFQPHTYTRTRDFYKDFGRSFDDADILIVTDVYPAREKPIEGINGQLIADQAVRSGHKNVHYVPELKDVLNELKSLTQDGDMVITMGAGDVWKLGREIMEA